MANIKEVEGIGQAYAVKLNKADVQTTDDLLEKGATSKGRKQISDQSGISEALILEWVNHVDLFRIKGVGSEYADLLEAAGVDTVPELAQRNAENLTARLTTENEKKKIVRKLPTLGQVTDWIDQAKTLKKVVTY